MKKQRSKPKLLIETRKVADLKAAPYNPRSISPEALKGLEASIRRFGVVEPIIVNKKGMIIGGHQRKKALEAAGVTSTEVIVVNLSAAEEKALNVTLNNPQIAGMFTPDLDDLLKELRVDLPEFEELRLDELKLDMFGEDVVEGETGADDVPDVPKKAKSKVGDLWLLGEHRLLCGDCTVGADVERLMDGEKADMVFTDPPYNLDIKYGQYNDKKSFDEYRSFCSSWFNNLLLFSKQKMIITCGKQNIGMWFTIKEPTEIAVWIHKNGITGGKVSNLSLWEPILFYGKFNRNSRASNLYEYELRRQDIGDTKKEHPCPKQVDMIIDIVKSYSNNNALWLDVFLGSGTTLIAAEQLGRKCYAMEIEPLYIDVAVKRWENFTGKKAKLSK